MLTKALHQEIDSDAPVPREGDLFKVIQLRGKTFDIRYGYYEERDRNYRYAEPMEIYPDFLKHPEYTEDGFPFVTAIQEPCIHFDGKKHDNITCEECSHYLHGEELIGICTCPKNRKEMGGRKNE